MKEIKFRAWDKKEKRMSKPFSFGDLVGYEGEGGSWVMSYPDKDQPADLDITNNGHLCDIEIMQYTGLKDKNGVEIYEGDIVEIIDKPLTIYEGDVVEIIGNPFTGDYNTEKHQVIWSNSLGGFFPETLSKERIDLLMGYVAPASEIIGNIYENPELLN